PVDENAVLKWSDVDTPDVAASVALTLRREMEATLGPRTGIVRAAAG
ncbi:MAG: hypothetical protein IIA35_06365, partial [Proteobacteria bacterium]|nr:hypothetical protein [Pseudomonadota bacterium]